MALVDIISYVVEYSEAAIDLRLFEGAGVLPAFLDEDWCFYNYGGTVKSLFIAKIGGKFWEFV